MSYITDLAELIREEASTTEIAYKIAQYIDDRYKEHPGDKPTVQQWLIDHSDQLIQWLINEHGWRIIEAFLMTKSSNPTWQSQGNDRLLNYATKYEDLRNQLTTIATYPGDIGTTSSTTTTSTTTTSTTMSSTTTSTV